MTIIVKKGKNKSVVVDWKPWTSIKKCKMVQLQWKQFGGCSELSVELPCDPAIEFLGISPKIIEKSYSNKCVDVHVNSSIHKSKEVGKNQMSIIR